MSNPSRDWITENNRVTLQYKTGVNEFIRAARRFPNEKAKYRCPCKPCNNVRWHDIGVVRNHLLNKGFTPGYTKWYHHGELERVVLPHEEDSIGGTDQRGIGGLHGAVEDIRDHEDFDDATEPTQSEVRAEEQVEDLFAELEAELYPGYMQRVFFFVLLGFVDAPQIHEPLDEQVVHRTLAALEEVSSSW